MKNVHQFDVLVVYSQGIAASASTTNNDILEPFSATHRENYNTAYAHFLSTCKQNGLKAAFTTTSEIVGAGTCKSYWIYENNAWVKVKNFCYAPLIFDKFSPVSKARIDSRLLLFSNVEVSPFNDAYLLDLFHDKHKTYELLKQFSIPTVSIKNRSILEIKMALRHLKNIMKDHSHNEDFSSQFILKDRNGAGGEQIYKIVSSPLVAIQSIMNLNKSMNFILQPFVNFDKGFSHNNVERLTDIRLIFMREKLIQVYIRMASKGEFLCNEHRGGILEYVPAHTIPNKIQIASKKILKILGVKSSLFALDFILSNNGNVFLLEGNTGPGIDWNLSKKENERKGKELIRHIVKELIRKKKSVGKIRQSIDVPLPNISILTTSPL